MSPLSLVMHASLNPVYAAQARIAAAGGVSGGGPMTRSGSVGDWRGDTGPNLIRSRSWLDFDVSPGTTPIRGPFTRVDGAEASHM